MLIGKCWLTYIPSDKLLRDDFKINSVCFRKDRSKYIKNRFQSIYDYGFKAKNYEERKMSLL